MNGFEFDPTKSKANLEKHGIDFEAVQALWNDPQLLEVQARSDDEERFLLIGKIDDIHWSVVVTYRGDRVRLISARRSRKNEVALYES